MGARSSSVFNESKAEFGPGFAFDGNRQIDDHYFKSEDEEFPWLEIELKNNSILSHLDVFHVMDYNDTMIEVRLGYEQVPTNFSGEQLEINTLCGDFTAEGIDGNEHLIQCSETIQGQYLTMQLLGQGTLKVLELELNPSE